MILAGIYHTSSAQNLVPNPGFESYQSCPGATGQLNTCTGNWGANGLYSPDYFNTCAPMSVGMGIGIPHNNYGFQYPSGGNGYAGFFAYSSSFSNAREFISTQLTAPLIPGTKYFVSFKVNTAYKVSGFPAVDPSVAVNNIGLLFTVNNPITTFPMPSNGAHVYSSAVISDTLGWTTISGSYLATDTSRYITIGNLFQDAVTTIQFLGQPGTGAAYYYVDDVCVSSDSLACANLPVGEQRRASGITIKAYPNPAADIVQIDIPPASDISGCLLSIKNIVGAEVFRTSVSRSQLKLQTAAWEEKDCILLK